MSKKSALPLRIAPLQRVIAVEITDPTERAALDKAHRRYHRKDRARNAASSSAKKRG